MGETLKKRLKQQKFSSVEQELVLNLLIAANYIRSKIDSLCIRFNITHAQFNVLRILKGASPEGYPRGGITQRMVEPAPDVTRLIDRLVNDGLVERYLSETDRRLSMARITKKGINLLNKINPEIDNLLNEYSSSLSNGEKETFSNLCEKLYAGEVDK